MLKKSLLIIAIAMLFSLRASAFTHGVSLVFNGLINVTSYGAVCDGVTDDTTAIRNAVTAAGGSNTNGGPYNATAMLLIPGRCLVTQTIVIRNANNDGGVGQNWPFIVQCTGGGAGLIWGGADNTGPLLTLGDATLTKTDGPFSVNDCFFSGSSNSNKPSVAIYLAMTNGSSIIEGSIGRDNGYVYAGVKCGNTCLLTKIDHLMFSCQTVCIQLGIDNGSYIANNNFYVCGTWCYYGNQEAVTILINNYFEGNVVGSSGSVYIAGDGDRLIANTFEDQGTASGSGFLSVNFYQGNLYFEGNYYVGGCATTGCPDYYISIGGGNDTQAEFHGETLGSGAGGHSGYVINATNYQPSTWYGGFNCTASTIWGGAEAAAMQLNAACSGQGNQVYTGKISITNLPTSCSGLPTGTLWNNSNAVNVCP